MRRYRCSGRTAGAVTECTFQTDDDVEAFEHFERLDHDVEPVSCCGHCEGCDESDPCCVCAGNAAWVGGTLETAHQFHCGVCLEPLPSMSAVAVHYSGTGHDEVMVA